MAQSYQLVCACTLYISRAEKVVVTSLLLFQIAAKIGGDAGPPMNNSNATDAFPFTAQKRQLEDAGSHSFNV